MNYIISYMYETRGQFRLASLDVYSTPRKYLAPSIKVDVRVRNTVDTRQTFGYHATPSGHFMR